MSDAFKFKIVVVGDGAVGKTSLIKRYTTNSFEKDYIATLGMQFSKYEELVEGENVELLLWDLAGQPSFSNLRDRFYKGSNGAIIAFSLAPEDLESWEHIDNWLLHINEACGRIPIILLGNKADLVDQNALATSSNYATSDVHVKKYVQEHKIIDYYKTSALSGQGVKEAFQALVFKLYQRATI
ncbi:MAG: Rab family GTPase [Promethearchaeota archaeon]|jgi:small GTP-binding protein